MRSQLLAGKQSISRKDAFVKTRLLALHAVRILGAASTKRCCSQMRFRSHSCESRIFETRLPEAAMDIELFS